MTGAVDRNQAGGLEPRSRLFDPDQNILDLLPWSVPSDTPPVPFSAARWPLDSIDVWPDYSPKAALSWAGFSIPEWRVTAKEAALGLLVPRLGVEHRLSRARRTPYPPWAIAYQRLSYWRRWFDFLAERGHATLDGVTQDLCNEFRDRITPNCRHIAIGAVRVFSDYGDLLTYDRFRPGFRPWGDISAVAASGEKARHAQNKTERIPDVVLAPLLAGSLFLVSEIGPELVRARREVDRLLAQPSPRGGHRSNSADFDRRLARYLSDLKSQGLQVPQAREDTMLPLPVSLDAIALNIGMKESRHLREPARWDKIAAAASELGVGPGGLLIGPTRLIYRPSDLKRLTQIVLTACYIVTAALSGMRSSELAAIGRRSYRREVLDGGVIRYRVVSKLLKGKPPGGRRETWTVVEQVVDALKLAEKLTPSDTILQTEGFAHRYRAMRDWINGLDGSRLGLAPIPEDWVLIPRQFRRTLARELAWRPNGVIAGKIHLKHISVATTEGYAGARGQSANAFIAEIEAERREAARELTREVLDAIEAGEPVTGLGAREIEAAVAALNDGPSEGAQFRNRDEAITTFVRARAGVLHPMPLCYCWFLDPERARCLRNQSDKSRPLVGSCQPDKCANATIHPQHAPAWLAGVDDLSATLKAGRVPAGERARISAKVDEMKIVVDSLLEEPQ